MQPRRLYAHRGAAAERPENTLPAFERALEIGVDALELDVHLTRDGQAVVAHDPSARRMAGADVAWADLDVTDLARLDAGWGFVAADGTRPFAGRGIHPPTLPALLAAVPGVRLNIDLKTPGPALVEVVLAALRAAGAEDQVTLASFHGSTLRALRRARFRGETALSRTEVASLISLPAVFWRQLPTGSAAQVPTHHGPLRFDRAPFIAKCHSLGLRVDFWTIDDPSEARRLLALGADGIMTNDPAAIRRNAW